MPATEGTLPVNRLWQYQRDLVLLRSLVAIVEAEVACSCSKDKKKMYVVICACSECPIYTRPEHGGFVA